MNKDEAIQVIRNNYPTGRKQLCEALETLIPELKESDDEKIRKTLKSFFDSEISDYGNVEWRNGIRYGEIVSWLEKQGEQKPSDKVEPKFKVGDWIVYCNEDVDLITGIEETGYLINKGGYIPFTCQGDMRLWTIKDAKDGDVLACPSGWTCIFKSLYGDTFSSYCFIDKTGWFCEKGSECHTLNKEFTKAYNGEIKPATKEQRNLLFQKMHEAGYVWDSENIVMATMDKQKPAWSEEDEKMFSGLNSIVEDWYNTMSKKEKEYYGDCGYIDWLKSIKERIQSQSN